MLLRYAAEGSVPIVPDVDRVESMGVRCVVGNFLSEGEVLRHARSRENSARFCFPTSLSISYIGGSLAVC